MTDVPNRVGSVAAGIIGQKLCVLGLTHPNGGDLIGCIQLYDFDTKTWEMGPRMPERLNRVSGAVVQGEFHVVGKKPGSRQDHWVVCLSFNPKSMAWKCTAPAECVPGRGLLTCHAVSHRGSL